MDQLHSNTEDNSRKRGTHLTLDERGAIQILNCQGLSLRSIEEILSFADKLNSRPRRVLGYHTPEDLFETFLDKAYAC
jgi:IS30 family transposase